MWIGRLRRIVGSGRFGTRLALYLGASWFQALIALASIPLTTKILGPADFGVFALLGTLVSLCSVITEAGATILISTHHGALADQEGSAMLAALWRTSLALAIICAAVLWGGCTAAQNTFGALDGVPPSAIVLAALSVIPTAIWTVSYVYLTTNGRAARASALSVAMSLSGVLATQLALYVFRLEATSLYVGSFVGPAVAAIGSLPNTRWRASQGMARWYREIWRCAPSSALAGLSISLQAVTERSLLASYAGVSALGLYNHSQQYGTYLTRVVKALTTASWPTALAEARNDPSFPRIGQLWRSTHAGMVLCGLGAAVIGPEFLSLMTHDKFTAAAPLLPVWITFALLQNSGKAALAVLYSGNRGVVVSRLQIAAALSTAVLFAVLIPALGVIGAVLSVFTVLIGFRISVVLAAARLRTPPFQDQWVVVGCVLLPAVSLACWFFSPGLSVRLIVGGALSIAVAISARSDLAPLVRRLLVRGRAEDRGKDDGSLGGARLQSREDRSGTGAGVA